jgi:hypothetical protein
LQKKGLPCWEEFNLFKSSLRDISFKVFEGREGRLKRMAAQKKTPAQKTAAKKTAKKK